jgi:uncharacterized protein YbjT (DUF2867 family)
MKKIVVAGATGNLGTRIVHALLEKGAAVNALVRSTTDSQKITGLEKAGAIIHKVDMTKAEEIAKACTGASCVVSALAGLRDVIIDTQKIVLDGAVLAGTPRFIPSDYSLDFTKFSAGENRNLDWRREFHTLLDASPISATTIFNGSFMDMLTGQMPLILSKKKRILYWGHADHRMTFTTVQDTAVYTANAALNDSTPRFLRIAGDQLSPREIKDIMSEISGKKYRLFRAGGLGLLSTLIRIARRIAPGKKELYPAWQGMQYMRNMIDERATLNSNDNNRYPGMHWTTAKELLTAHQNN